MSRLKVNRFRAPKPAPSVLDRYLHSYDLKELYFHPEQLPPITPERFFGNSDPMVFDLGCGRGDFLIRQAAEHPNVNYVGFDLHWKALWDAINKSNRAGLPNIRFIRTDYRQGIGRLVPDGVVREAYLLFPPPIVEPTRHKEDPLPDVTIHDLHRVLIDGAPFHLVTDSPTFFHLKIGLIESTGLFEQVALSRDFEGGLTWYQQLWEKLDYESLRVEFRRKD